MELIVNTVHVVLSILITVTTWGAAGASILWLLGDDDTLSAKFVDLAIGFFIAIPVAVWVLLHRIEKWNRSR